MGMTENMSPRPDNALFAHLVETRKVDKLERLLDMIETQHNRCRQTVAHQPHEHYRLSVDGVTQLWCDGR
jgi:hypothetical protein